MNKNIMCVCAGRDTADIGFYDVDVFDDKIGAIKLEDWKETTGLRFKDIADLISELCYDSDYSMVIIDSRGAGVGIVDELEKDSEFTTSMHKASLNSVNINFGIAKLNNYTKSNKFSISEEINVDLNNFSYKMLANGKLVLDSKRNEKEFMNIVQFFAFIEACVLDDKRIKNKTIIEDNLREILEILVDDLCNADKSNTGKINDLVRLIDKVNYIRNQY